MLQQQSYKPIGTILYKCFSSAHGGQPATVLRTAQHKMISIINTEIAAIKAAGTYKAERVITSKQGVHISVANDQRKILNFCSNNYLGLSSDDKVIRAGERALESHGAGLSSVRFICGTQDLHKTLEKKIAEFHQREDAILYSSCFDANAGLFECLLSEDDAVLSDELNHASIIDGIRLCKATRYRYKHLNMEDLEQQLKDSQSCRLRVIATDGVFSMDGNVAPLKQICHLADKYDALVFVDDCHSTGFFGKTGRGTEEFCDVKGHVDIINSTFGKALGGASGGYTVGPKALIDLLRQRSRPYLFSNALPPSTVAQSIQALALLRTGSSLICKLSDNTKKFRGRMTRAGFKIGGQRHPICPVMLGDAKLATQFADLMLGEGIYVIGFSYPVVPKDTARIRVQLSAAHSSEDIDKAVDAFIKIGKHLRAIA